MGIVIAIVGVLAVLGSLFWIMPSAAERRRMKLRQIAIASGVKVQEARAAMLEWQGRAELPGTLMLYYRMVPELPGDDWVLRGQPADAEMSLPESTMPSPPQLQALDLGSLPSDLLLWEKKQERIGFYWFERGDAEQLRNALKLLLLF